MHFKNVHCGTAAANTRWHDRLLSLRHVTVHFDALRGRRLTCAVEGMPKTIGMLSAHSGTSASDSMGGSFC
jgi:hypothetical protein